MEVVLGGDEVFGRLDCNDNTPILRPQTLAMSPTSPQQQQQQQLGGQLQPPGVMVENEVSPGLIQNLASPIRCPSSASSTSDSNATYQHVPIVASSPTEDNINNDFFYDDEFTGFDDNLGEGGAPDETANAQMLDSSDINNILSLSRIVDSEDNEPIAFSRIITSKSDSCLYQADLSMSSDGAMVISQDHSFSEGDDVISSSDLSELRSEPLFSPPPEEGRQTPSYAQVSFMDSLAKSGGSLNNSFLTDEERYTFDWTANKDKYMISCVHDEDSSLQDSCPSGASAGACASGLGIHNSLSSWAQRSSGQITWSSHTSSCKESGPESDTLCDSPKHKATPRPRTKSLTTWATIKKPDTEHAEGDKLNKTTGLTSWKSLKEENTKKKKVPTATLR